MKEQKLNAFITIICIVSLSAVYLFPLIMGRGITPGGINSIHTVKELITNKLFLLALKNTVLFTLFCIISINVLGFIFAYLLSEMRHNFLFCALLLPMAIPVITTSSFWIELILKLLKCRVLAIVM